MSNQNITLGRIKVPAITSAGVAPQMTVGGLPASRLDPANRTPRPDANVPGVDPRNDFDPFGCGDMSAGPAAMDDAADAAASLDVLGIDSPEVEAQETPPPATGKAQDKFTDADGLQADFNAGAAQVTTPGGGRVTQTTRDNINRHGAANVSS